MKKSTIWAITIIMADICGASLCAGDVHEEHTAQCAMTSLQKGVKRSLYAVTGNLEQDETQYFS